MFWMCWFWSVWVSHHLIDFGLVLVVFGDIFFEYFSISVSHAGYPEKLLWKVSHWLMCLGVISQAHWASLQVLIPRFYPWAMLVRSLSFTTLEQWKHNPNKNMCFFSCRRRECFPQAINSSSSHQWKKTLQKRWKSMLSHFSATENSTFLIFANTSFWSRTAGRCIAPFQNKTKMYGLDLRSNKK